MGDEIEFGLGIGHEQFGFAVRPEQFEYLKLQKGSLDYLKKDPIAWGTAYAGSLKKQYLNIRHWLPKRCGSLLDVGSGLGGIDILISRHYVNFMDSPQQYPRVFLLDGIADPPVMTLHRKTFNHMGVAARFLTDNGIPFQNIGWFSPDFVRDATRAFFDSFDLIVSFGSWCFHYEPNTYLPQLLNGAIGPETVVIIDVRADRPSWDQQLSDALALEATIKRSKKWDRRVYRLKT